MIYIYSWRFLNTMDNQALSIKYKNKSLRNWNQTTLSLQVDHSSVDIKYIIRAIKMSAEGW